MKNIKLFLLVFLLSFVAKAQDKSGSKSKDTIGETKVSPIIETQTVQAPKVIICGPSKSSIIQLLYVLDGKIVDRSKFNKINPNDIKPMEALQPEKAKLINGDQGKNGAIIIVSKK